MRRIALPLLLLSACSFTQVKRAPSRDPGTRPLSCTTASSAPTVDAVVGGLLFIAAVASSARSDNSESSFDLYPTELGAALLGVSGIGFGISSLFGFNAMSGCRKMSAQPASIPPAPPAPPAPPTPPAPPASTPASDAPASPPPSQPGL